MMKFPSIAQDELEFEEFLEILDSRNIESILEIGVWHGGTLARFGNHFPNATIVGIDPDPKIERWCPEWGEFRLIYGRSQDNSIRGNAITANFSRKFDVIFIDGEHEYNAAKVDWNWSMNHATKIVAFHDIADPSFGVSKLWREILNQFPCEEIIRNDGRNGIGVVFL